MSDQDNEKLEVEPHIDLETALDKALEESSKEQSNHEKVEATQEQITKEVVEQPAEERPEPPAEFNRKEQEAWTKGDFKGIRAGWDRVNQSRQQEMYRKDTEHRTWKNLAERLEPSIKAAGLKGKSADQFMVEAITLLSESQKDPYKIADEIAKVTGFKRGEVSNNNDSTPQFLALQDKLDRLVSERENEKTTQITSYLGNIYQTLQMETNENGASRYPGLMDDDLAHRVGSLVKEPAFQQAVMRRIPNPGPREYLIEAYKWEGGEVIGSSNSIKSQSQTKELPHSEKARKASISQPGRSVQGNKTQTKRFASTEDAIDAAINDLS